MDHKYLVSARWNLQHQNNFGLGFRSTKCLGHLRCKNDSCEHFFALLSEWSKLDRCFYPNSPSWSICTRTSYLYNCVQVLCCKSFVCEYMPLRMYYVIHKLQSLSRTTIHLGTHEHLVVEGMCKESLEEIKVLVEGQVSCTHHTICNCLECK